MPTKRMIKAIAIASTLVVAMAWPDALSAQRHGGGGGGRGGGGGGGRMSGPSRGGGGGHDGGGQVARGGAVYSGSNRVYVSRPYYSRAFYGPAYYYGYYGLGYYSPFIGSPFWWGYPAWAWGPYGWGGYPWYGYGYGLGYGYGGWYDPRGTARIMVKPKQTEVFVDGAFVGVADDFDGVFQGMKLDPGGHEITLYLDGYRVSKHKVMLQDGKTLKLKLDMEKLGPGESMEARPVPPPTPPRPAGQPGRYGRPGARGVPADDPDMTEPPTTAPPDREGWPPRRHPGPPSRERSSSREAGHLVIRVQPAGADVLIDGERWEVPNDERLDVAVPEGEHTIEIRKDGYQPFSTTVVVKRGENTPLNVSLPKVR